MSYAAAGVSSDAASEAMSGAGSGPSEVALAEYVSRAGRLAPLVPLLPRLRPLPHNLALELTRSVLYEEACASVASLRQDDDLWAGRPQLYFESMHYADADTEAEHFPDSLAT